MLAVLYDIHANLPALEAVLDDAQAEGADSFLLGGDYASLGAWPVETLARLRALPDASWLRGNWERWQGSESFAPSLEFIQLALAWVREALGPDDVAQLAALAETITLRETFFCHASPISDMRTFAPEPAGDDAELLGGVGERRVVFGHSHIQFRRLNGDGVELINAGSVGLPFDGDTRAAYALVREGGEAELRRVEYDHEHSAAVVRERMPGFGDDLARRIETAQPPG